MKFGLAVILICAVFPSHGKERISLNYSYANSQERPLVGKNIVESGQSIEKEIGRGDIDTVVTLIPSLEKAKSGAQKILVEVSVKNFREGDLISETNPQIVSLQGDTKKISLKDEALGEDFSISLTAKTVR